MEYGDWGLGTGDWGPGNRDWGIGEAAFQKCIR
jgi:hypothetical protein